MQKLLLHHDVNVISVDWGGGSAAMYSTAAANTRLVGLEIAHLLKFLKVNFFKKTLNSDGCIEVIIGMAVLPTKRSYTF